MCHTNIQRSRCWHFLDSGSGNILLFFSHESFNMEAIPKNRKLLALLTLSQEYDGYKTFTYTLRIGLSSLGPAFWPRLTSFGINLKTKR